MSYYEKAFTDLIKVGVPKWYIRLHAINHLTYCPSIYFYRDMYDAEAEREDGWYIGFPAGYGDVYETPASKNRKCYGELKEFGFPTYAEYIKIFEGDEAETPDGFMHIYEQHKNEWLEREEETR